jgi:glutamate/tyrosine decarboxylase-like PLP-dependent enzyme
LERCVIGWLKELMGFDQPGAHGILVSGGSMASLTALAAARHRAATRLGWDIRADGLQGGPKLTLYGGGEVHACVKKSAELMGLGHKALRQIGTDARFHIDLKELEQQIENDRKKGFEPFCIVGSAGTVNTGAVDDLDGLADIAERHGLWFHVDGAYGAFGVLDPDAAPRYRGMTRADSLALDPHKWMAVPIECGCTLVRDGANLRDAFSLIPPYIRIDGRAGAGDIGAPMEYGFQLTRGFRAFKVWATLMHIGRDGLAETVARHIGLARHLRGLVEASDDLELLAPVELSIVCFRYAPAALKGDDARLDELNKAILARLQADGESYPSQTLLDGRFAIRANIMHYATTTAHVERLADLVRVAGEELRRANQ